MEPPVVEVSCSMAAAASCISAHTKAAMHSGRSEPGRQTRYDDAQRALRHLDEASARKFAASTADLDVLHTTYTPPAAGDDAAVTPARSAR